MVVTKMLTILNKANDLPPKQVRSRLHFEFLFAFPGGKQENRISEAYKTAIKLQMELHSAEGGQIVHLVRVNSTSLSTIVLPTQGV